MKKIFTSLLIITGLFSFAQTEKLLYYVEKDSLLGVKNQVGKIIIPLRPSLYADSYSDGYEIKTAIFTIDFHKYYNRKGDYLFDVYLTSEGPDVINEGFIRYTENKKSGLYSDQGKKIIPAQYDWISQINFGFAEFCNGCRFDYSKDPEHPLLIGGTWGYVGKNGIEIQPTEKRNHRKDFETEKHQFIPYQFEYNEKEKQILDFFEKRKKQIIQINGTDCEDKIVYFEIVGKPTEFDPFYNIRTFELCDFYLKASNENYDDFKNFKVSADGKKFYAIYLDSSHTKDYVEYVEKKIPVDKWIKKNLKK
ncbi:hypothetical protein [Flavobacterium poyangense]|uniref:hypothetical protein n=1 Tax=Flavobacterium poyangense TaxID=2204302 RepID=UPI00142290FF|nr:hypothetical protein [Flavobacterium sp. JXAS1]